MSFASLPKLHISGLDCTNEIMTQRRPSPQFDDRLGRRSVTFATLPQELVYNIISEATRATGHYQTVAGVSRQWRHSTLDIAYCRASANLEAVTAPPCILPQSVFLPVFTASRWLEKVAACASRQLTPQQRTKIPTFMTRISPGGSTHLYGVLKAWEQQEATRPYAHGTSYVRDSLHRHYCTRDEFIFVSRKGLATLPDIFGYFDSSTYLSITKTRLQALPNSVDDMTQLQRLNLCNNRLTRLPRSLSRLTQLKSLDLSHNQLSTLPSCIAEMRSLQHLDLSHNTLRTLTDGVGELRHMRKLNLTGNHLETLPDAIGTMTALRELLIDERVLTLAQDTIAQLPNLWDPAVARAMTPWIQAEDRRDNKYNVKEAAIRIKEAHRAQADTLDLRDLCLSSLPDCFAKLQDLHTLHLAGNHVRALPLSANSPRCLKTITVGAQAVQKSAMTFRPAGATVSHALDAPWLPPLASLMQRPQLAHIRFEAGPNPDRNVHQLRMLTHDALKEVARTLHAWCMAEQDADNIDNVRIAARRIMAVCTTASSALDLSYLGLASLPEFGASHLDGLRILRLDHNKFLTTPAILKTWEGCLVSASSLHRLEVLNLSYNGLTAVDEAIMGPKSLLMLDLSHNNLCRFPDFVPHLRRLQYLDLSHNAFSHIPYNFVRFCSLHTLRMCDNKLSDLSFVHREMAELTNVDCANNALTCLEGDLTIHPALRTLRLSGNPVTHKEGPATPKTLTQKLRFAARRLRERNRDADQQMCNDNESIRSEIQAIRDAGVIVYE